MSFIPPSFGEAPAAPSLATLFASVLPVLDEVAKIGCQMRSKLGVKMADDTPLDCGECLSCEAAMAAKEVRAVMERMTEEVKSEELRKQR